MVWLPTVKKIEDTVIRFDRIHERDGQTNRRTDGRTPHDSIGRARIAWRGENGVKSFVVQVSCAARAYWSHSPTTRSDFVTSIGYYFVGIKSSSVIISIFYELRINRQHGDDHDPVILLLKNAVLLLL